MTTPNQTSGRRPAREVTPWGDFELKRSHLKTGVQRYQPPARNSPQEALAAALTVVERSTDHEDAGELLDMLGLRGVKQGVK